MQIPKIESESVLSLCTGSASFIHSSNVLVQLDFYHSPSVWDFLLLWSGQLKAGRVWGLKEEEDSGNETNDGHGWRRGGEVHAPRKENWFGGKGRKCNMLQKKHPPWDGIQFHCSSSFSCHSITLLPACFSQHFIFLTPILKCLLLLSVLILWDGASISKNGCFFSSGVTNTNFIAQDHKNKVHGNTFGQTTPTADWV